MSLIEKLKDHFHEIGRIKQEPHEIALGFALGTFFALLPTFGLAIALGFLAILIHKRISKFGMIAAFLVWNPLVQAPLYVFSYWLGETVFAVVEHSPFTIPFLHDAYLFTRQFLLGIILLAVVVGAASYPLVYRLVMHLRKGKV